MSWLALFAIAYRCILTHSDFAGERATVNHVIVSGTHMRIDVDTKPDEAIMYDVLLSEDAGTTFIALNTRNQTWFDLDKLTRDNPPMAEPPKKIAASLVAESPEKYVGKITYKLGEMNVERTFLIWTTDKLPAAADFHPIALRDGAAEVDALFLPKTSIITGFPEKIQAVYTRQYPGGRPVTALTTSVVDEIHADAPEPNASKFKIPAGYVNQLPQIGAPGAPVHR